MAVVLTQTAQATPDDRTVEALAPEVRRATRADRSAFYIHSERTSSYAMVHRPPGEASGVAILMCPSYGWDELCIHRVKYRWASELAAAGHTVLRFDLPGTGDSAGEVTDSDQLGRWCEAVAATAGWLRADGASRIVAFGVGLGAMLAWLTAAEGAAIDDLMLWQVPRCGQRFVRSVQAAAQISFATGGGADPTAGAERDSDGHDPLHGGFIEESGQIMTGETIAALKRIDLREHDLPDARARKVLLFARAASSADAQTADWLNSTGVELSVSDGEEFTEMMRYVQVAQAPAAAIGASIDWLANSSVDHRSHGSPIFASDLRRSPSVVRSSTALELKVDGAHVRECPVEIPVAGEILRGTVTEPIGQPLARFTALYLSGNADRRTGPNGDWVSCSRRWATMGVRSVRLDLPGLGDSDGEDDRWREARRHFGRPAAKKLMPLMDALQNRGYGEHFVCIGFCSGSAKALRTSFTDDRVIGVFGVDPSYLLRGWSAICLHDWWVSTWEPKPHTTATREQVMRAAQHALHGGARLRELALRYGPRALDRPKAGIVRATRRPTEYLFLIKPGIWLLAEIERDQRRDRLPDLDRVTVKALPDGDCRYRTLAGRRFVARELDAAIERVRSNAR